MRAGSTDIWVNSIRCLQETCLEKPQFAWSESSTYQSSQMVVSSTFGSGSCEGVVGYDSVTIGGVTAKGQMIQEIVQEIGILSQVYDCL